MTYTFEILRIVTEKETAESDEVIQHIKYCIHGTNDASPAETAFYSDTLMLQDSSPQVLWSDSMSESDAIAIVRTNYDNDADFRTRVNDSIAAAILASRPITRVISKESLPWNS
tara:strand:+ start:3037 stop:3378 length:342 start_codon:yes stop_codon:yes gene_type:complete